MQPEDMDHDALVAEVRRLREIVGSDGHLEAMLGVTLPGLTDALKEVRAERDAARAEAERQRERADHNAAAVNENADEIVRLREASRRDGQSRSDAYQRLIEDRDKYLEAWQASVAEAARVREALQAVRELHQRLVDATGLVYCEWCDENVKGYGQGELWPCETVRALDAALDGAE